jgi:hypothetical protein
MLNFYLFKICSEFFYKIKTSNWKLGEWLQALKGLLFQMLHNKIKSSSCIYRYMYIYIYFHWILVSNTNRNYLLLELTRTEIFAEQITGVKKSTSPGLVISTFGLAKIISCMPDGLVKKYIGYGQTCQYSRIYLYSACLLPSVDGLVKKICIGCHPTRQWPRFLVSVRYLHTV